jgi:hypothetical protein
MRLLNAAKGLFRGSKGGSKEPHEPSLFDSGIGDWMLDIAVLALIAVVLGAVIKAGYLAMFHR